MYLIQCIAQGHSTIHLFIYLFHFLFLFIFFFFQFNEYLLRDECI